jgi:hypothetical protein
MSDRTTLRVRVLGVDGGFVTLSSGSEVDPFRLRAAAIFLEALGQGDVFDAEVLVDRDDSGRIVGGELRALWPLDGSTEGFLRWLEKNASGWGPDWRKELGRDEET